MKPDLTVVNKGKQTDPLIEYVSHLMKKPYTQLTEEEKWHLRALLEIDHFAKEWIRYGSGNK